MVLRAVHVAVRAFQREHKADEADSLFFLHNGLDNPGKYELVASNGKVNISPVIAPREMR
jgi:hypothetical protein